MLQKQRNRVADSEFCDRTAYWLLTKNSLFFAGSVMPDRELYGIATLKQIIKRLPQIAVINHHRPHLPITPAVHPC